MNESSSLACGQMLKSARAHMFQAPSSRKGGCSYNQLAGGEEKGDRSQSDSRPLEGKEGRRGCCFGYGEKSRERQL